MSVYGDTVITRRDALLSALAAALARAQGSMEKLLSLYDFESEAHTRITPAAWDGFAAGEADELTLRWNREAYDRLRLNPRVLVDVAKIDTRVNLLGAELPFPILLAPTGGQGFIHPEGDVAAAAGAAAAHATYVISSSASLPLEDIARRADANRRFQLYGQKDGGFTRDP